jgi:type IV secretory pathway ATPase VirB11/archaellum biosynthesis ATPase
MEPFINFVENKKKATILCSGSISSGKSSLLNALLGNCILPSGNLETTETITKLIPFQELNSNTVYLIEKDGKKKKLDAMEIYQHHKNLNTKEPLHLEIETQFLA